MRIYLAGIYHSTFHIEGGMLFNRLDEVEKQHRRDIPYILESYHYINLERKVEALRRDKQKVFLDSGAFSAFTKGITVDIKEYCDYIIRNNDIIDHLDGDLIASVLDSVGSADITYSNQKTMEAFGVRPLPCFHYGEDFRYLDYYATNYSFITIGGMVPISKGDLRVWLDHIWNKYLTNGAGNPVCRVHGFGLTTPSLIERYPWFSVDSSRWVQEARVGGILIDNVPIKLSDQSPARHCFNQHLENMPPIVVNDILQKISNLGYDINRLCQNYVSRWAFNCNHYNILNRQYSQKEKYFKNNQEELFT